MTAPNGAPLHKLRLHPRLFAVGTHYAGSALTSLAGQKNVTELMKKECLARGSFY
jgi:hypothetical protein